MDVPLREYLDAWLRPQAADALGSGEFEHALKVQSASICFYLLYYIYVYNMYYNYMLYIYVYNMYYKYIPTITTCSFLCI